MKNKKKTALPAKILLALIVMCSQVFSVYAETQDEAPGVQEVQSQDANSVLEANEDDMNPELNEEVTDDLEPSLETDDESLEKENTVLEEAVQEKTLSGSDSNNQIFVEVTGDTESLGAANHITVEKLAPESPDYLDAVKKADPNSYQDKEAVAFNVCLLDDSGQKVQVENGKNITANFSIQDSEFLSKADLSTINLSEVNSNTTLAADNGLWISDGKAEAVFQTEKLDTYVVSAEKNEKDNESVTDQRAQNLSYKAYYYVLNPSSEQEITPTKGDTKGNWLGVATGQISGSSEVLKERVAENAFNVSDENPIYTDPNQSGITLTTDRGFADIVKKENGKTVTYQYVSSQQEAIEKNLEHFYTITWVRAVVSNGSTTDRNSEANNVQYSIPNGQGIESAESSGYTYHVDGVVTLNDSKLVTVVFNVKDRSTGNYVPVSDVQIVKERTPENQISQPGGYKPGMEVTDLEGRIWVLSEWYRNPELTDGPVDFETSKNPLKAPRMDYYAEFEEHVNVHYHIKHPDISPDSYMEHENCPHEKIKAGTQENTLTLPVMNNEPVDKGHQILASNGKTYIFSGWHKESPELETEKLVDFNTSTDQLDKHVNYYGVYALQENTLTITKTVTGNMGDKNQNYSFEISLNLSGQNYTEDVAGLINNHNGTYSLTLKAGESKQVVLPYGVQYSVKETDDSSQSYDVTYQIIEGSSDHGPIKGTDTNSQTLNTDTQVIFTNHKQGTVPTGLDTSNQQPIILIVCAASIFLMLYSYIKKRSTESY